MPIAYVTGDATSPLGAGNKIIPHLCNDIGKWGKGFVLAVSKKWPEPEAEYKRQFQAGNKLTLGQVQFILVQSTAGDSIWIANMVGQKNIKSLKEGTSNECPPIRYPALFDCLDEVGKFAAANNASIHAPRFGAGLAGGDWRVIEAIIQTVLIGQHGRSVTIYDLLQTAAPAAATQTATVDVLD